MFFCAHNKHPRSRCPARGVECHRLHYRGHFAKVLQITASAQADIVVTGVASDFSSVQFISESRQSTEYFIKNTGTGSDGRSCHLVHCPHKFMQNNKIQMKSHSEKINANISRDVALSLQHHMLNNSKNYTSESNRSKSIL